MNHLYRKSSMQVRYSSPTELPSLVPCADLMETESEVLNPVVRAHMLSGRNPEGVPAEVTAGDDKPFRARVRHPVRAEALLPGLELEDGQPGLRAPFRVLPGLVVPDVICLALPQLRRLVTAGLPAVQVRQALRLLARGGTPVRGQRRGDLVGLHRRGGQRRRNPERLHQNIRLRTSCCASK